MAVSIARRTWRLHRGGRHGRTSGARSSQAGESSQARGIWCTLGPGKGIDAVGTPRIEAVGARGIEAPPRVQGPGSAAPHLSGFHDHGGRVSYVDEDGRAGRRRWGLDGHHSEGRDTGGLRYDV